MLEMDWLVRYHTRLDCRTIVVKFCILGEANLSLDVRGILVSFALISGIRVRKLSSNGAQGYLTFLINTPGDKLEIKDVSVVREYSAVLPN